jgi:hypothetical protein
MRCVSEEVSSRLPSLFPQELPHSGRNTSSCNYWTYDWALQDLNVNMGTFCRVLVGMGLAL